jgi:hypothetical protein
VVDRPSGNGPKEIPFFFVEGFFMSRKLWVFCLAVAVSALGLPSVHAQDAKKAAKSEIQGGIEGHIKSVDADKDTLTITTTDGKDRKFTVNDDTTMLGPRGGVVKSRLKDHRFHEGMSITVVASGSTAKEIHLGYDRKGQDEKAEAPKTTPGVRRSRLAEQRAKEAAARKGEVRTSAKPAPAAEEEDEDNEFPGKLKSVDADRHMLVVSLLNGKDRSFMLASTVPILVKGAASKQGLKDPVLKPGTQLTVVTEAGGRKVKEVKVTPAPVARAKKPAA